MKLKDLLENEVEMNEDGTFKIIKDKEIKLKKFVPKQKEKYYFINGIGGVSWRINLNSNETKYILNHNHVFETEEQAEDYKWFLDKLDEYSHKFSKEEWDDINIKKYSLYLHHNKTYIALGIDILGQSNNYYFKSEEKTKEFIKEVEEERIKAYMFDIWNDD